MRILCGTMLALVLLGGGCADGDEAGTPWRGALPLEHVVVDPSPPGGEDCCTDVCAVGDLDGDGWPDLVVGGEHADGPGLVWYRYPNWDRHPVATGDFTTDMRLADVDRDGRLDILVGDIGAGPTWFRNPGGAGRDWPRRVLGEGYVHDLLASDLDGDGDIDVITCDKDSVSLWTGHGTESWTRRTLVDEPGEGMALADLDADGDQDLVLWGFWLETPDDPAGQPWLRHRFADDAPTESRTAVGDLNGDGRPDIAMSASEGPGILQWYAAPADPRDGPWPARRIGDRDLVGTHSLALRDLDGDGVLDLLAAEMHTGGRRILTYLRRGDGWQEQVVARHGSHNMRVADLDRDGDLDLIGKNYAGPRVFEFWRNRTADRALVPDWRNAGGAAWEYRPLDTARPADQFGAMGVVAADWDGDGWTDLAAGSVLYRNPGAVDGAWTAETPLDGVDLFFAPRLGGDARDDLVGFRGEEAVWLRRGPTGDWSSVVVAAVPGGRTQGAVAADLDGDGRDELVFTRGGSLQYLAPGPASPWPLTTVADETEEEGVAALDLDADGDPDLVTSTRDGFRLLACLNPGTGGGAWPQRILAATPGRIDRIAAVDIDGDGALDLVVTEESQDWIYDSEVAWFSAPAADPGPWQRHRVALLRSVNSLGVADFDGDGRPDLAVAEHTDMRPGKVAADNRTLILRNRNRGRDWDPLWVDVGPRSSHLGMHAIDLDRDGDLDLVSPGWRQYRTLHAWYNPGVGVR